MPRHIDIWMDGVALSTVGPILVQQVYEDAPTLELLEGERPGRYGSHLLSLKRQTLKVAIEFAIQERFDLAMRTRVLEDVAKWAQGSVLEMSNHPERRLNVRCTAQPTLGEVRDYTNKMRIEFTAYAIPYWQDKTPQRLSLSGANVNGTLLVPGTVEAPVEVTVTPISETLTDCTVNVGGQIVTLTGMAVLATDTVILGRDVRDDMTIVCNGTYLLSKRTAASADDLLAQPGMVSVSCTANTACNITCAVRGRWA